MKKKRRQAIPGDGRIDPENDVNVSVFSKSDCSFGIRNGISIRIFFAIVQYIFSSQVRVKYQ